MLAKCSTTGLYFLSILNILKGSKYQTNSDWENKLYMADYSSSYCQLIERAFVEILYSIIPWEYYTGVLKIVIQLDLFALYQQCGWWLAFVLGSGRDTPSLECISYFTVTKSIKN